MRLGAWRLPAAAFAAVGVDHFGAVPEQLLQQAFELNQPVILETPGVLVIGGEMQQMALVALASCVRRQGEERPGQPCAGYRQTVEHRLVMGLSVFRAAEAMDEPIQDAAHER